MCGSPLATVPGHRGRPAVGLRGHREQRREGPGGRRLALDDLDPAGLRHRAGVDEVHALRRRGLEQPAQDRRDQRRGVVGRGLAGDLEGERPRRRGANWPRNRPSVSASGRYGAIAWAVSGVSSGALTAYRAGRPSRTSMICSATSSATATCASAVEAPRCGVSSVFGASSSGEPGRRLGLEHVDRGAGDPAVAQGLGDVGLVEDAAAGDVEQQHAGLHAGDGRRVDQAARRRGSWGRGR